MGSLISAVVLMAALVMPDEARPASEGARAPLIDAVREAVTQGRDREAIVALQSLKRLFPDDHDVALWQITVAHLARRIGDRRQIDIQLRLFLDDITSLRSRSPEDAQRIVRLAEPVVLSFLRDAYIGGGCTRSGAGAFALEQDGAPRVLVEIAQSDEHQALAFFVLAELHAWNSGFDDPAATALYMAAIDAAPWSVWAKHAERCVRSDADSGFVHRCGRLGAEPLELDALDIRELLASSLR